MTSLSELIDETDMFQFANLNKNHQINKSFNSTENLFNLHKKSEKHNIFDVQNKVHDNKKKTYLYFTIDYLIIFMTTILLFSLGIHIMLKITDEYLI